MTDREREIEDVMLKNDPFSKWLGIERIKDGKGISFLKMTVRKEMLNGFNVAHGGITYSLADSALAFASNTHRKRALSIETSISHISKVFEGDVLQTSVRELSRSDKLAVYEVLIENQHNELVAAFKGSVYISKKEW